MPTLTPTQQKDLETYRTTGELGSLSNILIEDCLEELKNSEEARNRFNSFNSYYCFLGYNTTKPPSICFAVDSKSTSFSWVEISKLIKPLFVQTLLSRTLDGQAVMSFLDVETKKVKECWIQGEINGVLQERFEYFSLDHYLHHEFNEALRLGKGFYNALKIINKLYIFEIYV